MATFELYHLSLGERTQPGLFSRQMPKAAWLKMAFAESFAFDHRGKQFHWVPHQATPIIAGVVERQYPVSHYAAPEEGGKPTSSDLWQGAVMVIDPEHHADGQKVAFQRGTRLGQPLAVLESLVTHINALPEAPYIITVRAIWDDSSFRDFAARHNNVLRTITFDFVVPNMFDLSGKLDEKLKRVGEDTGAKHVKITLESPDGVRADAPEVKAGVDYGAKGQATLKATALDGERYSSTNKVRTSRVSDLIGRGKEIVTAARGRLGEVLGRDDADTGGPDSNRDDPSRD